MKGFGWDLDQRTKNRFIARIEADQENPELMAAIEEESEEE